MRVSFRIVKIEVTAVCVLFLLKIEVSLRETFYYILPLNNFTEPLKMNFIHVPLH